MFINILSQLSFKSYQNFVPSNIWSPSIDVLQELHLSFSCPLSLLHLWAVILSPWTLCSFWNFSKWWFVFVVIVLGQSPLLTLANLMKSLCCCPALTQIEVHATLGLRLSQEIQNLDCKNLETMMEFVLSVPVVTTWHDCHLSQIQSLWLQCFLYMVFMILLWFSKLFSVITIIFFWQNHPILI